jgi:hypothetical protein
LGKAVNHVGCTTRAQKSYVSLISKDIGSFQPLMRFSAPMTQRASNSLVQVLIRVGLLLVLAIMLMAENAMA